MDDIPKITFKPVQTGQPASVVAEAPVTKPVEEVAQEPMARKKKFPIGFLIFFIFIVGLVASGYAAFTKFVVWDDGAEVDASGSSTYIPAKLPPAVAGDSTGSEEATTVAVKGKLTVTINGEGGKVLSDGLIRLLNSSGKTIKEVETGKTGVAVFDGLMAGSYKIEGGKKGEKRVVTQSVSLTDGELKDVTITILVDTPVTITVNVKKSDGSAFADQAFTLRKIVGDADEPDLDYNVTTNNFGMFTKSDIAPNDNWLLMLDSKEVGSFSVAPTGKSQTINVQTTSN